MGHEGFPTGLREVWELLPEPQTIEVRLWHEPAGAVPAGREEQIDWLFGWWPRSTAGWTSAGAGDSDAGATGQGNRRPGVLARRGGLGAVGVRRGPGSSTAAVRRPRPPLASASTTVTTIASTQPISTSSAATTQGVSSSSAAIAINTTRNAMMIPGRRPKPVRSIGDRCWGPWGQGTSGLWPRPSAPTHRMGCGQLRAQRPTCSVKGAVCTLPVGLNCRNRR